METGGFTDTKPDANVSNEMLLNVEKDQGYRFYHFKPTERGKIIPLPRLGLKIL